MGFPDRHPSTGYRMKQSECHIASLALILIFYLGLLSGCGGSSSDVSGFQGVTMGTTYSIKYVKNGASKDADVIKKAVDAALLKINAMMSTWEAESDISLVNQADSGQWINLHPELSRLIDFAFELSRITDGKYDVTLGPIINLWGFGPKGERKIPADLQIEKAMQISGYDQIIFQGEHNRLKKRFKESFIDLSSIAKGYGVDKIATLLEESGITDYMVEIGGEIRTGGMKKDRPWKIAIESPRPLKNKTYHKVLNLTDCAVATSGDYRNFFIEGEKRYSHTIDPEIGRPVQNDVAGVTVAIPDGQCFKADAWATALMVSGKDRGMEIATQFKIPAHFIYIENEQLKEISTIFFIKEFL